MPAGRPPIRPLWTFGGPRDGWALAFFPAYQGNADERARTSTGFESRGAPLGALRCFGLDQAVFPALGAGLARRLAGPFRALVDFGWTFRRGPGARFAAGLVAPAAIPPPPGATYSDAGAADSLRVAGNAAAISRHLDPCAKYPLNSAQGQHRGAW